jgi:3-phosphoshikimate 1-carboxyvinyltransferase
LVAPATLPPLTPDALRGRTIDVRDTPDLVPPLAAIAANATGTTVIANAGRLRLKESDRLKTVRAALTAMGASVEEEPDALVIHGTGPLSGGTLWTRRTTIASP